MKLLTPNKTSWFWLITFPFFLNDFLNIFLTEYRVWLIVDFLFTKATPLLLFYFSQSHFHWREGVLRWPGTKRFFEVGLPLAVICLYLNQTLGGWLLHVLPMGRLSSYPEILNPWVYRIDLTFGLLCVAWVEEFVFRGLARIVFQKTCSHFIFYLGTSLIFGMIHWSLGVASILVATMLGWIFMWVYIKCDNLWPVIFAHFLVDFVAFSKLYR